MRIRSTTRLALGPLLGAPVCALAMSGAPVSAPGSDQRPNEHPSGMMPTMVLSSQQIAIDTYKSGVAHKERALGYLKDASVATSERDRAKAKQRADDQFHSAMKDLKRALSNN